MMLREKDENLWASPRVPRHFDSGGLTRSSEKASNRVSMKIVTSEGVNGVEIV